MSRRRRFGGRRLDYRRLSTTGEKVYIDCVQYRVQEPLDDSYDEVLVEDEVLAEEVQTITMSNNGEHDNDYEARMKELIDEDKAREKQRQLNSHNQSMITQLASQVDALADDIYDHIDEHPTTGVALSIRDMDAMISKCEELRSVFRAKHRELERYLGSSYDNDFRPNRDAAIGAIKQYIVQVMDKRNNNMIDEEQVRNETNIAKAKQIKFLNTETTRRIAGLELVFIEELSDILDEDVTSRKSALPDHQREMLLIAKSIQDLIGYGDQTVEKIKKRYDGLNTLKYEYTINLEREIKDREIEKQKNFNKQNLDIDLVKFKGYKSNVDIYSFQDQFEKLYLQSTPKCMLPDVLINRYLEGPAQLLVKGNDDIDDIWIRLKEVFGDINILLSNKLAEFKNMDQLSKLREPVKMVEALSRVIYHMKDLMRLAKRHDIENELYYSGAINKVYQLMGEGRLNRWLSIATVEDKGEDQWNEVIQFLEKELKVHQQKVNIFSSSLNDNLDNSRVSRSNERNNAHHINENQSHHNDDGARNNHLDRGVRDENREPPAADGLCSFCGEPGHVQTSGPGGVMLIQYFACKKFVDSSPAERFQSLRAKGFCIQCLFPGADGNEQKHAEGRCQRDFVCKHTSHDRHTVKKHVLLCEDHKNTNENKQLLYSKNTKLVVSSEEIRAIFNNSLGIFSCLITYLHRV